MVLLGTKLNWKVASVCLEIVLILTQDRCTVCAKRTIGSDIVLDASDDVGHVESRSVRLEMVLVLTEDSCTVCAKRTIG